jgi:CHAT domain-containing protein/tetratricopeptide (TPR) repeat protein
MGSCVLIWRSRLRMVVVAAALVGSTLTAWAYAPQAPALSDAQKDRLKERDKLNQQARAFRAQGKTAEAIRAAESMLAIERDVLGKTSDAAVRSMKLLALWNEDREDWTAARKARSDVLAVLTQKLGKDSEDVIEARWALEKVETLSRASDHDRRRLKEAIRVEQQARELLAHGKLNEAMPLLRQVLAIKKDVLGERASGYVVALMNLGLGLQNQGQSDEALGCYMTALQISQQICNNSHSLLALNLEYIAGALILQGKRAPALQHLERALRIYQVVYPKERYPEGHYFLAHVLNRIGCELDRDGKYVEARQSLERACEMYQRLYPKDTNPQGNPDLARSLHDLAAVLAEQRNFTEARRYFERALEMDQRLYPKDKYPQGHPDLARTLRNLGSLLDSTGNPGEARPYLLQALEMLQASYSKKTYPLGHPEVASILDLLGRVSEDLRDFPEARRYYLRALEMSEALYPKERYPRGHRELTVVLVDLGRLCGRTRQFPEASEYYQRALRINRALYPKGHPDLPSILNDLAWVLEAQGNYDRAQQHFEQAVETYQVSYPRENYPRGQRELATALANLGTLELRKGEYARAWSLLNQALEMCNNLNELFVAAAAEAEALGYLALTKGIYDRMISCSFYLADSSDASYAHVWARKAMIARMLERRQASLFQQASSDPAKSRLLADWNDRRRELSRLILAPSDGAGLVESLERIRQVTEEKERLERQLADSLPEFAREERLKRRPHSDLQKALSDRMVLLDFVQYTRREQDPRKKGNAGLRFTPSYAGFVLAKGRPVERLDLGPAAAINDAVKQWRAAIVEGRTSPAAHTLRRLVWEPIARRLPAETNTVVIAPDGLLTAIPWAALPGARPGTFLVEQYALAVAPHAPFVLDRLTTPQRADADDGTLLAIGAMPSDGPGSVRELETVISLARPRRVVKLQGDTATTTAVLRALPRARWVHFDTHGFFASPEIQSLLQADPDPLNRLGSGKFAPFGRNPLVLSGLLLSGSDGRSAGAGAALPDPQKILTAEAIAGLPLSRLDLAVLSACETGLGTVAGGEGVFGLQRAFHLAGAQTVVASLWSVKVGATEVLMAEFYKNLWEHKLPKLEALRQAQLTMIKAYRHRVPGRPASRVEDRTGAVQSGETDQLPPVYWAGFVLSGDWR